MTASASTSRRVAQPLLESSRSGASACTSSSGRGTALVSRGLTNFRSIPLNGAAVGRRGSVWCRVAETGTETCIATSDASVVPLSQREGNENKRIACFSSTKKGTQGVAEEGRPLSEYMALPASQYSVLDARRIERIDDTTFRCYVGGLNFFSFTVEPVLTVSVTAQDRGCTIKLLSCTLQGSSIVERVNNRFTASMTNVVTYEDDTDAAEKQITSDTTIEVSVIVPRLMPMTVGMVETTGRSVISGVLNTMVPRFLAQLEADYNLWATGDESRKPIGDMGDL